jgi:hypothetical protein
VPGKEKEDLPVALVAQGNNRTSPGNPETGLLSVAREGYLIVKFCHFLAKLLNVNNSKPE